jgi:3-phosphoshikimate 1-carboxyvinyltransferase
MTLKALYDFGADISIDERGFTVRGVKHLTSPKTVTVDGDWSNAAFMLAAGAIAKGASVCVTSLDAESLQGDRAILELLVRFGADVRRKNDKITVRSGALYGIDIDATNIPDLVPILAVIAAAANGRTVIRGASRLRLKESDRLSSVSDMLFTLGASIAKTDDGLIIDGGKRLAGGAVSSHADHRIAMSAAVAALLCDGEVTVTDADAVEKSYPAFWDDIATLGFNVKKN